MSDALHAVLVSLDEQFHALVDDTRLQNIAAMVLEAEAQGPSELSVLIADEETVRRLNREYAGDDASTDVLAFSLREGEEFVSPDEVQRLGEVIISYPTALRQAEEAGRPVDEEIAHLLVHGILHLLGYDHAEPEEERLMRERTEELLASVR
jgi:probable rRNA maturation factor